MFDKIMDDFNLYVELYCEFSANYLFIEIKLKYFHSHKIIYKVDYIVLQMQNLKDFDWRISIFLNAFLFHCSFYLDFNIFLIRILKIALI